MSRRLLVILWIACWPVLAVIAWDPLRTHLTRAVMIFCAAGIVLGLMLAVWKRRPWRYALMAIILVLGIAALLPLRRVDTTALRASYVQHLLSYRDVAYVWGGENGRGVDCSGLVRAGLIDAEARESLATCNPGLLRDAASLWWFKCNARNLRDRYRNQTREIFTTPALRLLDDAALLPGDFAVTADGTHALAYIGHGTWIQADPDSMHVMTFNAHHDSEPHVNIPMHIMRWRRFDPSP
jgi:hypothetical protein